MEGDPRQQRRHQLGALGLGIREHGDGIPWLIYSWFAVALVLFYSWVPFVALPIYVVLENMDRRLLEAAQDPGPGGCGPSSASRFPSASPGVIAAFVFVLIPTTGEFIAPLLVGGPESSMFGNSIQAFFSDTPNWNYGAVLAVWLIAVVLVLVLLFGRYLTDLRQGRAPREQRRRARPAGASSAATSSCSRSSSMRRSR